ncbi:MAG: peptide ABC transporter substrate-binding protein [Spirochaetales bacterium]|nr:peptide ABC transporter substrate-binding protein [Spirochaetales bacterium]
MKKLFNLMIILIVAVSAVFAGGKAETTENKTEGAVEQKLTFALQNEPDGLDPGITNNSFASPILLNTFEGLVIYDENNSIVGGSAESWDISDDGLTYTFKLRNNLKWSDGSSLTANDFVYSYLRVLDPALGAQYTGMLTDYISGAAEYYEGTANADSVGIKAVDKLTLEITLLKPTAYYIGILGMWVYSPVNEATVTANGDRWTLSAETFVSNGPFTMKEISFGEGYKLVKNENYWNAANVKLENLNFRFIPDPSTALVALDKGDIDGQWEVPSADLPSLKADSDALQIIPSYGTTYYEINCSKAPYDNPKVRLALSMALDRTALIENVLQSTDEPAFSLIAPGYSVDGVAYDEGRSNYGLSATADVAGARAMLAEAGYPNGEGFPTLELSYYTNETVKNIVEAMQQMWQENLGIKVNVSTEEWAVYYENIQALKYDVGAMGWGADYMHPMTFFPLRLSDGGMNNSGYASAEYDTLVKKAQSETDPAKAMELMRKADDVLMADMPLIPLYFRSSPKMMAPYVKGWYITPLNNMYLSGAYIEK